MNLNLSGLIGIFILLTTLALVGLLTLIFLVFYLLGMNKEENMMPWSKYFFLSGIVLLLFDGMFLMFLVTRNDKTMDQVEGKLFDERMLFVWTPVHIAVYFLFPFALSLIKKNENVIKQFLDKYR
jgi:hypothetical protein